jgi:hypothetical protein
MTVAIGSGLIAWGLSSVSPAMAEISVSELKNLYGADLQVVGQVQKIDLGKGLMVVAGQHIAISEKTVFSVSENSVDAIKLGDVVAISGALNAPVTSIDRLDEAYVAGATVIFVKGKVAAIEKSIGVAKIDDLAVDFTPAMSSAEFPGLEVGEVVEAIGTQPSSGGTLLASGISVDRNLVVTPASISGSSIVKPASISGSSMVKPASISGSSLVKPASISGSSLVKPASISGSSLVKPASISGSSLVKPASISGSSLVKPASISGSSLVKPASISGSSLVKPASISGSSMVKPDSISGSS